MLLNLAEYLGVQWLPDGWKALAARWVRGQGAFLNPDFVHAHRGRTALLAHRAPRGVNALSHQLLSAYTLPLLLRYEDRNSMAWSVESRTPFADDRPLIEYLLRVDGTYKIRDGWSKALLREAMKSWLPPSIHQRTSKIGFDTPQRAWLQQMGKACWPILEGHEDFLDRDRLIRDWDHIVGAGTATGIDHLWRILIFGLWRRVFRF